MDEYDVLIQIHQHRHRITNTRLVHIIICNLHILSHSWNVFYRTKTINSIWNSICVSIYFSGCLSLNAVMIGVISKRMVFVRFLYNFFSLHFVITMECHLLFVHRNCLCSKQRQQHFDPWRRVNREPKKDVENSIYIHLYHWKMSLLIYSDVALHSWISYSRDNYGPCSRNHNTSECFD